METAREILERFLNIPINDGSELFQIFSQLPGACQGQGKHPLERYVFIPGTRDNPILLVAHADTVWDNAYGKPAESSVVFDKGVFRSANPNCGIGADDRAGCAMLWALRNCDHSLLLVDGEEKGKHGARFLRKSNPKLFRQINRHQFLIELDWKGTNGCLYNQVENTQAFKDYILSVMGFRDDHAKGGCDLQILCQKVCGVNIGVGYHNCHHPKEVLVLAEWENTYEKLTEFLQQKHPQFKIPLGGQILAVLKKIKHKMTRILRKISKKQKH